MILKHVPGKQCTTRGGCGRLKALSEFSRNAKTPDGYSYLCRACTITRSKKRDGIVEPRAVLCRNPKASEAGWIVAFCECAICAARRRRKAQGK
jgi:hypothetical protein